MAIIRQGILGGFRNKVGTVVGAAWRKLDVIRSLPRKSNKPPTQTQKDQRSKFALVTGFLSYISDLIDSFYQPGAGSTSAMNEAVAYHLKNAIIGVAPDFEFDFTKLRFSTGKLRNPAIYDVVALPDAEMKFTWSEDGSDSKFKDGSDMISVMVYEPINERFVLLVEAATRSELEFTLLLPPDMIGNEVYCYFSFTSDMKKKLHSKSVFVKKILVV